jgi:hypothetical protein
MRAFMRWMLIPSLLAATLGLFATITSNDPSVAATLGAVSAKVAAGDAPSKSQALAFARAVNLTAADVPGFTVSHQSEHSTATEKRAEGQLMRCLGESASHKGQVELGSKDFEDETSSFVVSVSSEVTVMRTPALAAHGLALIKRGRTRACVSHYFNLLVGGLKTPGAKVGKFTISTGTPPAPGTRGSFGWRLSATITVQKGGTQVPFYLDILGFVYGRAEVTLLTSSVPQPFPSSQESRLFALLVKRAKTHSI